MTKQIQIIPKSLVFPVARVLDKEDKELYQEVERKTAEQFGKNSLAYKTITNGIDINEVTGSQLFLVTYLGKYLPKDYRVISFEDAEAINNLDETFFRDFYTDFPEVCLRTKTTSLDRNKCLLESLVNQVKAEKYKFSSEDPLRISNLELIKDENPENQYGLLLKIGNDTRIINDKRFAHSNNGKKVAFGEKQKTIWTREDGLSGVSLGWDSCLGVGDWLLYSYDDGRVVLVSDAEGVARKNY